MPNRISKSAHSRRAQMPPRRSRREPGSVALMTKRLYANLVLALNSAGSAPEWIELIPRGPEIDGRDGRNWKLKEPGRVARDSLMRSKGLPLPLDYEHASEKRGPKGEEAPAAGWINALEERDGAVWGRVEWTPRGAQMVADREYRFVSPVFFYDQNTSEILFIVSAGLTNQPNLVLKALNRSDADAREDETAETPKKEPRMTPESLKALCRKLGLQAEASDDAILSAIDTLADDKAKALNRAETPSLDKFVPRADFDAMKAKAEGAQAALNTIQAEASERAITAAVDGAVASGKVAPASKEFYLAMCRKGGLDEFNKFVASAPVLTGAVLDKKDPGASQPGTLTDAEKAVCQAMGLKEDDFLKAKNV